MKRFHPLPLLLLLLVLLSGLPARAAEITSFAGFPFGLPEAQSEATAKKLGLGFKEPWGLDEDTHLHVYSGKVFGATAQLINATFRKGALNAVLLEYSLSGTGMNEAQLDKQAKTVLGRFIKEYGSDPAVYTIADNPDEGLTRRIWKLGKVTVRYTYSLYGQQVSISASLEGAKWLPY